MPHAEPIQDETPAALALLLENHRAFLRYLERRVGDRELAEDILQDAFTKVMDRPDKAPADEGVVPWFYRLLRNAAIDQFRRRGAASRALEGFAKELETYTAPEPELEAEICACVIRLAATLKPEYAEALQAIDVQGTQVKAFAEQQGLSASNAGVRVFRAREALKKRVTEYVRHLRRARMPQLHLPGRPLTRENTLADCRRRQRSRSINGRSNARLR